jgi:hypothetical protein
MSGSVPARGGVPRFNYDAIWDANRRAQALFTARRTYSAGADSSSPLNVPQRAHAIGDPVPIVFARRRNDAGGILISPRATECRFENSLTNEVTAFYHLVLSEGQIGDIEVRDVFQRQCRVGSFHQTYSRRAGSWIPENAIVARSGFTKPEASNFCGSPGTYEGISTMSFQVTIPNGLDVWNRQVHAFIRNGIEVYRWADEQADVSSDSFADLAYWLMVNSARIPAALIDTASIQQASRFLNANSITTNCWITQPVNYGEFVTAWGRYHLLQPVTNKGKVGLRPLLPINEDYTIKTSAVSIEYVFDDDSVIPGSVDLQYVDWASRQPFVCQVIWRQQNEADIGVVRTSEVRYDGTAPDGPYESHDLSQFCTREIHSIRVGAYILAKRVRSDHSIKFRAKPGLHSSTLQQGSIVRVRLRRAAQGDAESFHDRLYEVERIQRAIAGEVLYEANYLPVDGQLRSLIALDVMAVTAFGVLFPSGLTGEGCDLNSDEDTTVPDDDEEDTIIPGPGDSAIEGGGGIKIDQGDFLIDDPGDDELIEDAEFDDFIDELTPEELIAIIDDLVDDVADELRELTDEELEELADDELTAEEIRDLTDEELIELLEDPVKEVIKEDLDLDFDPELVEELIEKVKEALEKEQAAEQEDPLAEYEAGIYFHTATWADNVLTVRMRLAPTGKAPRADLGNLNATIASTSVVALLPSGRPVSPQPGSLPSVSFSGLIAEPWDAEDEGAPFPPADRVFEGQFVLTFYEGAFPPAAEDPAQQLTYRATVAFSSWTGGFTDVSFLNTLSVDFVPTEAPELPDGLDCDGVLIYFPSTAPPLASDEGAVITRESSAIEPYSTVAGDGFTAYTIDAEEIVSTIDEAWNVDFGETEIDTSANEFTVQYLVKQEGSTGTVRMQLFKGSTLPANTRFEITTYSTFILASQDGVSYDSLDIANNSSSYVHYAIQKIGGNKITVHRNGQKIYDESTSANSPDILRFRLLRNATTEVAISPIRIQDRAVYGDAETIEPLSYPFCLDELVIWYPDEAPPQATIAGYTITADPFPSEDNWGVTTFQGQNALTITPEPEGEDSFNEFESQNDLFKLGNGLVTIEWFCSLGAFSDSFAFGGVTFEVLLYSTKPEDESEYYLRLEAYAYHYEDGDESPPYTAGIDGIAQYCAGGSCDYLLDQQVYTLTSSQSANMLHVCWQRTAVDDDGLDTWTLHIGGQLIETVTAPTLDFNADTQIDASLSSEYHIQQPRLSQIRISNSALYGTGSFTPPTEAFYVPPP